MKRAVVLGYGVSGRAAAALLQSWGVGVVALDRKAGQIDATSVPVELDRAEFSLDGFDAIVLSPGVDPRHPLVVKAHAQGIEVIGELDLALRAAPNRCIGITGTNGKTTVTLLVSHALNRAGVAARAVGNVGVALSEYLLKPDPKEILVIELSSFQLETLRERKLSSAAYLNLTPDHLDRYPSLRDYAAAKARIQDCLIEGGALFVSRQIASEWGDLFSKPYRVFDEEPFWSQEQRPSPYEAMVRGLPEEPNLQAALALCAEWGIRREQFESALQTFRKPAHRIEFVRRLQGVDYFNDSKGTNIDAVMYAMRSFDRPVVLIVGGVDKGASYRPWIDSFREKVRTMVAYGEAAPKIEAELAQQFPLKRVQSMGEAIVLARQLAREGDAVLLSPGCSSYDQFRNFADRGEQFVRLVKELS
jgi:UDP-N-acetylmuramoylalanine--D-glutamate ligase